ncbi:MAG: phage holin family protein [Anaerolineales bacterium]|nr:phage holin family protein [Anaerolineales bacterium]
MGPIRSFLRFIIRLIVVWFVDTVSLLITAWIIPGISFQDAEGLPVFVVATAAALLLGLINLLIRPLILYISASISWIFVFVVGFFINAIALRIASALMEGFTVDGWLAAFIGGLFLAFVNLLINDLLNVGDEDSFYYNLVLRQAAKEAGEIEDPDARGVFMLEIDGLSYHHVKKAIEDGYMPHMKKLMDEHGYQLSRVDCGLPSSTPACQAGILQGNNTNMPAFRWMDKENNRMVSGGPQMSEIEPLLSNGRGLLEGGTSIGNMFSGDADKSILTLTKLFEGSDEDKKKRAHDMYLLMRNPYFFMRVLVLFFADVIQELWQYRRDVRNDVQPRINRLHKGYPFLRATTSVFLRDVGAYLTILDIVRGVPAIYTLWAGYDEVAHHTGPWTRDAMLTLTQIDRAIGTILDAAEKHAPRPYEFMLLSDHGQSFGATFEQRYGISITDFVQEQLPQGTQAVSTGGGDDGTIGMTAMMSEMQNMNDQKVAGSVGTAVVNRANKSVQSNLAQQPGQEEIEPANMTLCYSGNLAQVYFDLAPRKLTLNELNEAYPDMVDTLVRHEGIGFVVAFEDDMTPIVHGKGGTRNLHTGEVVDEDPLTPYGDPDLRAMQIRRIVDFPNSGDLTLNSPVYPDGTVAAYEELIGSHGGIGGEQTDAFILHPGDMEVPETHNSYQVKEILKSRVGLPGATPVPDRPEEPVADDWTPSTLGRGLARVGDWVRNAALAITLHRDALREIGADPYMTGPALLLGFIGQVLSSLDGEGSLIWLRPLVRFAAWFLAVLLLHAAARLLRGKADFSATLRIAGFAQAAHVLGLLGFLPVLGPLARLLATILSLASLWVGTVVVHDIKGWRTVLLPVFYIVTLAVSVVFLGSIIEGTAFAIENLLIDVGAAPAP